MHHVQLVLVHHQNWPGMRRKIQNQSLGTDISRTINTKNIAKVKKNCYYTNAVMLALRRNTRRKRTSYGHACLRCVSREMYRHAAVQQKADARESRTGRSNSCRPARYGTILTIRYFSSVILYYLYLIILPFFFMHFLNDRFCPMPNSA
jgi:hypothetical protein